MAKRPRKNGGVSATQAHRAPADTVDDDPWLALCRKIDFYPTPPWAARAMAELVKDIDPAARIVWEPACGMGHMAEPLTGYFEHVFATDIHPFGYGEVADFLDPATIRRPVDWVFSNPPFPLAAAFVRKGLEVADRGVAMLCRLSFLETQARHELLHGDTPVTFVCPFAERVPMQLGSWDPELSTAAAYAVFIWVKGANVSGQLRPIAPGARKRFARPTDVRRFAGLPFPPQGAAA